MILFRSCRFSSESHRPIGLAAILEKITWFDFTGEKNHKWHQRTKFILLLFCPDKQAYFASLSSVWSCFENSGSKSRTSLTVAFEPTTPTQLGSLNKDWEKLPKYVQKSQSEKLFKRSCNESLNLWLQVHSNFWRWSILKACEIHLQFYICIFLYSMPQLKC